MSMLPRFHPRHLLRHWPKRRPFDPYLVGYWPCREGSGSVISDESDQGNHAAWTPATWADGKLDKAALFDGTDDYGLVAYNASLNLVAGVTVMGWAYITGNGEQHFFTRGTVGQIFTAHLGIWGATGSEVLYFRHKPGNWMLGNAVVPKNQWIHFAGVHTLKEKKTYLNGVLDKTMAEAITLTQKTYGALLGALANPNPEKFLGGRLCEVKYIGRALSDAEILRDYLRLA